MLIFAIGLALFYSGFLLNRLELPTLNQNYFSLNSSKVVLIVIDALRFDFMAQSNESAFYLNKMPIFQELAGQGHGLLIKGKADAPTTTLQRLKGITTGSLPTFIESSTNFNSQQFLTEDNLISQAHANGKKLIFMGNLNY